MENILRHKRKSDAIISRMSRGLVACAECRRMKLKCDKKIPCSTCVRRECSSICPTGILGSRQASRTALVEGSSGRRTQEAIARLRERNIQLEDALAIAHSHVSKDIHPLLANSPPRRRPEDDLEVEKVTEVLGTLTVGEAGDLKYFGPSAEIETLLQAAGVGDKLPSALVSPQPNLGNTLESFSTKTPLSSTLNMESFVSTILNDLPERIRAWSLCETFYKHYPMYTLPIPQEELIQVYLSPIYNYLESSRADRSLPIPSLTFRPHRCAIAFFAFALGAWLDLSQEHYWVEADRYFQVGLSCLSMQSIFYSPEVASAQALFLLAYYNELRGAASTSTLGPSWMIISLACKIAQALGLHRDSAYWDLDKVTVQRRRWLYWELVSMETLHSLWTGRPLGNRKSYIDAKLPDDVGRKDALGQPLQGFFRWKHEAVRDCYLDVVEKLLAASPAKYEAILELDRTVRAKEIPGHLNRILINAEDGSTLTAPEFMHTCIHGVARSLVLLSIHRSHLTAALKDSSGDPLRSRYAPSFLASYRAASWVVKSFHAGQRRFPALFARLWHPWTAVSTAAMVLGSIATHAPSSLVGSSPLEELRVASSMFEEAAALTVSHRTKNAAKIVQRILAMAEEAQALHSAADAGVVQSCIFIPPTNYGDDELAIFGGQARLSPSDPHSGSTQSREGTSYNFNSPIFSSGSLNNVHPSLIDFLTTAPMTQVASPATFQEIQMTTCGPPFVSPFLNPGFMPPQLDNWAPSSLAASQNQYHFGDNSGQPTSGLQISDTFENYLTEPTPVDLDSEPNTVTPWQDFMIQHSFT
ncbi:fungal-specific transcription factor domain-containing protein [Flagelloscypha sp. PMI_526]|nr:fungal-specific transcription factor domain-containing protein [Flagelloscypha sp. PMI_526]